MCDLKSKRGIGEVESFMIGQISVATEKEQNMV